MAKRILLLSGPVCSGKSTLADALVQKYGFTRFQTRSLLATLLNVKKERRALQRAGEALDKRTGGRWVGDALGREIPKLPDDAEVVVD